MSCASLLSTTSGLQGNRQHNAHRFTQELKPIADLIEKELFAKGNMPRFKGLCDFDLGDILGVINYDTCPAGSFIYKRGDRSDKMYLLLSGQAVQSMITIRDLTEDQLDECEEEDEKLECGDDEDRVSGCLLTERE